MTTVSSCKCVNNHTTLHITKWLTAE